MDDKPKIATCFQLIDMLNLDHRETAISMGDDAFTEEEISETIRAHKQIIANMRSQHWPMHRKLKVILFLIRHSERGGYVWKMTDSSLSGKSLILPFMGVTVFCTLRNLGKFFILYPLLFKND